MALSPMLEFVDTWDKYPLTGCDTELVMLGFGVVLGLCFGMAWLAVRLISVILCSLLLLPPEMAPAAQPFAHKADYLLLLFSPPWRLTSLRI